MTLEECQLLCQRSGERLGFCTLDPPELFVVAARKIRARLPDSWLALIPYMPDVIGEGVDEVCELGSPKRLAWWDHGESGRWLEIGSAGNGDRFVLDLKSAAMPRDSGVVWFDHETLEAIREWPGVIPFISDMLSTDAS